MLATISLFFHRFFITHTMSTDSLSEFKQLQREMWSSFAPSAIFTTPVAANLVAFAGIRAGQHVLDVGTGTGVAAITAARVGAEVCALDLTPELLEQAKQDAAIADQPGIQWIEGDAENLPYPDNSFDVVISQFGHMFAPRADVVVREVHRVLKPGGLFAFASWPPEHLMGRVFALVDTFVITPTAPDSAPQLWGDTHVITQRLANFFEAAFFERGVMLTPALSKSHRRLAFERSFGPMRQALQDLAATPEKIQTLRKQMDDLIEPYCLNNQCHQSYLMSRSRVIK